MALLSKREREVLRRSLRDRLTPEQRESVLRELKADDESVSEDAVDTKLSLARKP